MGVQWQLTGRQKSLTTPQLELVKGCCHGYIIIVFTVCAEVAVEEKVISSMSPPRLLVSAVQNAGNSSATGTCQGWDNHCKKRRVVLTQLILVTSVSFLFCIIKYSGDPLPALHSKQ